MRTLGCWGRQRTEAREEIGDTLQAAARNEALCGARVVSCGVPSLCTIQAREVAEMRHDGCSALKCRHRR